MTIDLSELRGYVSDMYRDVASFPRAEFHFPTGRPIMEKLGYPSEVLDRIPKAALESFAGVGYHFGLAPLQPGEDVLDLGSGSGSDAFFAALQVGPGGSVVGLDMTPEMLAKSRRNVEQADVVNVRFDEGHIEAPPFEDQSFDVVISNGVINLSPDKPKVFGEALRVLRPGGRLMFSDIVTGVELPSSVKENCELWAECIGGAEEERRYLALIEAAGFRVEASEPNDAYGFSGQSTTSAARKFKVSSIRVLARKP